MPFGKSLQVDMEVWHWKKCDMAYAVASYWYGFGDTNSNRTPDEEEAAKPFIQPPADAATPPRKTARPVKRFDNAAEGEMLPAMPAAKAWGRVKHDRS